MAVRRQHLGTVVVVAHPEVAEAGELHLDGRLGAKHHELAPGGAAAVQVAIERRAVRNLGLLDGAFAHEDVDHGAGPARRKLAS